MVQYCAVPQCKNNALIKGISFHVFPKEPKLRRLWEIKVRRDSRRNANVSSSMRICSEHFLDSDFKKTANNKNRCLKAHAVPSVFSFNQADEIYPTQDGKLSREREHITLIKKDKTTGENLVCQEYYIQAVNKKFNSTKLANIIQLKVKEIPAHPGLSQLNLSSCLTENMSERKSLNANLTPKVEKLEPKSFISGISDKENADFYSAEDQILYTVKKSFTYEKLVESISLIKKPNPLWTVSLANNFIICARWNKEYTAEKRIVIESTLTIRVFLREMEINITDFMDITSIDDISSLLGKVESYQGSTENDKF